MLFLLLAGKRQPDFYDVIKGKASLQRDWPTGFSLIPELHFTVEHMFQGVNTIAIPYRNQNRQRVSDFLVLRDDNVAKSCGMPEAVVSMSLGYYL